MGSDYSYHAIAGFETIAGVEVPVDEYGHHLDPDDRRQGREGKEEALELTSPYGSLHFAVGYEDEEDDDEDEGDDDEEEAFEEDRHGDWFRCFDYAELPDGRIILHAVDNSESAGYIDGAAYEVVDRDAAPARALEMVEEAMEIVAMHLREHDEEGWNQDPYYFVRAVAAACGVEPYASAGLDENRRGPAPTFTAPSGD